MVLVLVSVYVPSAVACDQLAAAHHDGSGWLSVPAARAGHGVEPHHLAQSRHVLQSVRPVQAASGSHVAAAVV